MRNILLTAFSFIILVSLASCGSNNPKAAAQKFLDGLAHMDYEASKSVASEKAIDMINMLEMFNSHMPDSTRKSAKKLKVVISDVKQDGPDKAIVTYTVTDGNSKEKEPMQTLKMENMQVETTDKNGKKTKSEKRWVAVWTKMDGMDGTSDPADANMEGPTDADSSAADVDTAQVGK
jgi:hypothetical protein